MRKRCSASKTNPALPMTSMPRALIVTRQRGLALVIVIWILTLLSLMAGSFALSMRRESSVAGALKNNAQAQALAETGLSIAQFMLQHADPEQRWHADGSIYRIPGNDSEIRIRILSESGKVDINAAEEPLLKALINSVSDDEKLQQHLLDALLDWRDADDEPRPQGAEKKQYRQAGLAYQPSNQPFQSLEELQLVLGFNADIFERLQPWITIYSGQAELNSRLAPPELLQIIGDRLKEQNIHDVYLDNRLAESTAADDSNAEQTDPALAEEEQTYTIMVQTLLEDQATSAIEAVLRIQNQDPSQAPYQILDWKQGQQVLALFDSAMESQLITVQDEFTNDH
ncbi:general secretion pathway protein K [Methylomonas methanica]|nr:general secretion pathway protein K [Methylomonas methanica]